MYDKFPLKYIGITSNFGLRTHPISKVSTFHYGLDLGWHEYKGEPIMAIRDGKVVAEGFDSSMGNYVVLKDTEENNVIINRFMHMKKRSLVKKGQKVKQGHVLGYMGETGYADGVHLHFEYWVCPKGYTYKSYDASKYAKDPLKYCYIFEDQKTKNKSLKKVVGTKVTKDKTKNQVEVIKKLLRCRKTPSLEGEILGYINLGYYNILEEKQVNNRTWYKIGNNKWIAKVNNYVKEYKINTIKEKEVETEELLPVTQDKDIENKTPINSNSYNNFITPKDGYYYIYLKKDEIIYFPK